MAATDLLSTIIGVNVRLLSKDEKKILEGKLFLIICNELCKIIIDRKNRYINFLKSESKMEGEMQGGNLLRELILDILASEEYSLDGLARCAYVSEEVLYDLAAGVNQYPTLDLSRKIIEIHSMVRRDLYDSIIKKVFYKSDCDYSNTKN